MEHRDNAGGDRLDMKLPAPQEALLREVTALGKPVVLVLLNGSAVAVNWAAENVPAIVEAWYAGQAAGTAIADVLFGDYNPAGRLPVTFYRSIDQLPPFSDGIHWITTRREWLTRSSQHNFIFKLAPIMYEPMFSRLVRVDGLLLNHDCTKFSVR